MGYVLYVSLRNPRILTLSLDKLHVLNGKLSGHVYLLCLLQ